MSETLRVENHGEPIVCRVTTWYYRRMGMMAGMCVAFGLYFIYDWKVGYPKANEIADKQEWFEKELLPSYDEAQKAGKLEEWMVKADAEGWPKGKAGGCLSWLGPHFWCWVGSVERFRVKPEFVITGFCAKAGSPSPPRRG